RRHERPLLEPGAHRGHSRLPAGPPQAGHQRTGGHQRQQRPQQHLRMQAAQQRSPPGFEHVSHGVAIIGTAGRAAGPAARSTPNASGPPGQAQQPAPLLRPEALSVVARA
ncbi:MAG: hypothetical protein ACK559_14085, partial [bacterium]